MSKGWTRWRRPMLDIGVISLLLFALSYLPPDTSLKERERQGILRFCVPDTDSGLIRENALKPGYELGLMQGVAKELGLRLQLVEIANMGRSFNPRDWQIGRGQCDILGGGLANSASNRSFLTLLPNGGRVGLVRIGGTQNLPEKGTQVGVYLGSAGLDRVRLSNWMRANGLKARPLRREADLIAWLQNGGEVVTSSLTALPADVVIHELPDAVGQSTALAFGLWRGDVTFTRAVRAAFEPQI